MATPPPTVAGRFSLLRHSAVVLLAAAVTFLIAIVMPPLTLVAAVVSVVGAVNRKHADQASASMLTAVAIGSVIAAVTYAALAIVNADFRSSGSGQELVPPPEVVGVL